MMICPTHWSDLQGEITARGLVADTCTSLEAWRKCGESDAPRNALLLAMMTLMQRGIEHGGPYLLGPTPEGGHWCPVCECAEHRGGDEAKEWVGKCVEAVRIALKSVGTEVKEQHDKFH